MIKEMIQDIKTKVMNFAQWVRTKQEENDRKYQEDLDKKNAELDKKLEIMNKRHDIYKKEERIKSIERKINRDKGNGMNDLFGMGGGQGGGDFIRSSPKGKSMRLVDTERNLTREAMKDCSWGNRKDIDL